MILRIRGSLGDEVALTALPREIRKNDSEEKIFVECNRPELFETNPHIHPRNEVGGRLIDLKLAPDYTVGNLVHQYAKQIGLTCVSDSTPDLYLSGEKGAIDPWKIAIDTWAGWPRRRWPIENWRKVAHCLKDRGYTVVEVGATVPDCIGRKRSEFIGFGQCLVDKLSVRQTAYFLRECRLFIGSDSGLMHVAAAVDTPQVVLYAVPWYGRAYQSTSPLFSLSHLACGCGEWCEHADRRIDAIEPKHVIDAIEGIR
jgi:hypothetical protein